MMISMAQNASKSCNQPCTIYGFIERQTTLHWVWMGLDFSAKVIIYIFIICTNVQWIRNMNKDSFLSSYSYAGHHHLYALWYLLPAALLWLWYLNILCFCDLDEMMMIRTIWEWDGQKKVQRWLFFFDGALYHLSAVVVQNSLDIEHSGIF